MRWKLEGHGERSAAGQGALFDGEADGAVVERRPGKGAFSGMEFLHVRARTIINSLGPSSPLPFRHTINAYRGCSHACTYCFARPSHEWLELDIDEGFERQVVVKVNAVERLGRELAPRRWAGESIAMGTNTDPYQRCEGIYGLTRGLVEVLTTHRNPFSILTKSTLVVRDLDLLAEASRRTDVTVNLSIGTLDPEVWRATEPGTPHPRRRVEAVARLRAAGVRCGVLVAPVLPGLSDSAAQLEAVVAACTLKRGPPASPAARWSTSSPGPERCSWPTWPVPTHTWSSATSSSTRVSTRPRSCVVRYSDACVTPSTATRAGTWASPATGSPEPPARPLPPPPPQVGRPRRRSWACRCEVDWRR